ncbi:prepilin-type N-terminal cleavage/methylation domain-containing protein [Candidatus Gracilibacteria bacterium]|nr:prepilin-type N-terminal cleavage/methylation domain-containing protein [Candidatus Gracilibacteria bacterium]
MKPLNKKLNYKGFTLVELIVVISILAILGTIAFLSFGGFSSKARDGTRISDTASLSKGIELYQVKSGYYPKPDGISLMEGVINGTVVAYKGEIQDQVSNLAKISKTPKDPLSNNYYIYGTTLDLKQYQIATTLENSIAFISPLPLGEGLGARVYADGQSYQAKVTGNYKGLLKYSDGTNTYLSNIPSLIYNSGNNLLDNNTYYSIDKSTNLPYSIQNATGTNLVANTILQQLTGTTTNLTKVDITAIKTVADIQSNSGALKALGYNLSAIEKTVISGGTVVGQSGGVLPAYSCIGTLVQTNANITNNTNLTQDTTYQSTNSANSCYYTCKSGYTGTNCDIYSKFPGEDGISGTSDDCDKDNIKIGTGTATEQIWSACNLGAKIAFDGTNAGIYNTPPSSLRGGYDDVNGKIYQWGRDKGFSSNDISQQSTLLTSNPNGNDIYDFIWSGTLLLPYDWLNPQINDIWGGSTTDSVTIDGQTDKTKRKGPCPIGWHVPSVKEFQDACNSIAGTICKNGTTYATVRATLLLPLAGYRQWKTGLYESQGSVGQYWSSSPSGISGFNLMLINNAVYTSVGNVRSYGSSIRCIKN